MTTTNTPTMAQLLRRARGDQSKRSTYKTLGVSAQTYELWEKGVYIPSDEYAQQLAEHLGMELKDVVWTLYRDRTRDAPIIHVMGNVATRLSDTHAYNLLGSVAA